MDERHLSCPRCGYDLHGIPESRCPECGFGFEYAALRALAAQDGWGRWVAARATILRATAAGTLAAPAVAIKTQSLSLSIAVLLVMLVGAVAVWLYITGAYSSLQVFAVMFLFVPAGVFAATVAPLVSLIVGTALTAVAWRIFASCWPAMPPLENTPHPAMRRSAMILSWCAQGMLFVTTTVVAAGWLL